MTERMLRALQRAGEIAHERWMESTRLEDAVMDDLKLTHDEEYQESTVNLCRCPDCEFRKIFGSDGRSIQ